MQFVLHDPSEEHFQHAPPPIILVPAILLFRECSYDLVIELIVNVIAILPLCTIHTLTHTDTYIYIYI